ncbi:MAG: hypothetical protein AABZ74_05735, partial [Cyanobacteriota bacterium]
LSLVYIALISVSFSCSNNNINLVDSNINNNSINIDLNKYTKSNSKGAKISLNIEKGFSIKATQPISPELIKNIRKYKISLCTDKNDFANTSLSQTPIIIDRSGETLSPPHIINFLNVPVGTYYAVLNIVDENDKSLLEPQLINNIQQKIAFSDNSVTVNEDFSLTFSGVNNFLELNPQLVSSKPGSDDFPISTTTIQQSALAQTLSSSLNNKGDGLITWVEKKSTDNDIYAMRVKGFNPIGLPFQVNLINIGEQLESYVSVDDNGVGFIAWSTPENGNRRVYLRKIESYAPIGDQFPASTTFVGDQKNPNIKINSSGNGFITFVDNTSGTYTLIKRDIVNNILTGSESSIDVALGASYKPEISINNQGNGMVIWSSSGLNFRKITAGVINAVSGIALTTVSLISRPSISLNDTGNGLIVWKDGNNIWGLKVNSYTPDLETNKFILSDSNILTNKANPNVSIDNNNNGFVVWEDLRESPTKKVLYGKKITNLSFSGITDIRITSSSIDQADQINPALKLNNSGNGVISWIDLRNGNFSVSFRHLINFIPFQ